MNASGKVDGISKASVYLGYGEADASHVSKLDEILGRITTPADQNAVLVSAAATRLMYTAMCDNLNEIARNRRQAA